MQLRFVLGNFLFYAVIYARYSSANQQGEGNEDQAWECTAFCEKISAPTK